MLYPSRVLLEPAPGFLFQLEPVPLRDALLDPPDQDRGGGHALDVDRLVGGEQRDPASPSCRSSFKALNVSRPERSMSSHMTAANRGVGLAASASSAASPPSRGRPTSTSWWAAPWPRCSRSRPPLSMSQKYAAMNHPGGSLAWTSRAWRRSEAAGLVTTGWRCGPGTRPVPARRAPCSAAGMLPGLPCHASCLAAIVALILIIPAIDALKNSHRPISGIIFLAFSGLSVAYVSHTCTALACADTLWIPGLGFFSGILEKRRPRGGAAQGGAFPA
jgi:hypothetical protein